MIRYRVDANVPTVTAVECESGGFPFKDADGGTQYENTHFDDAPRAWLNLILECEARVELVAARREECQKRLARATEDLADAGQKLAKARELAPERVRRAARTCSDCGTLVGECECN